MPVRIITIAIRLSQIARRAIACGAPPLAGLFGSMAIACWHDIRCVVIEPGESMSASKLKADLDAARSRLAALERAIPKITDWTSYAPTIKTGGYVSSTSGVDVTSNFSTSAFWRRVGDSVEVVLVSVVNSCPIGTPARSGGAELFW